MVDISPEQASAQQLGLQIGKVMNAYELYAGGELLGRVGKFPPLAEIDYDRKKVFALPAVAIGEDGSLYLAIRIHIQSLGYWQLWILPVLVLAPLLMLRKLQQGHSEAKTLIVGLLIFVVTCINDLLIDFVGAETSSLVPYGFVAIVLAMSISLANRFTASISELEAEVAGRTFALSAANKSLAEAAKIDPLTGLYNRRGFIEEAETEIKRGFRNGRGFSVILCDVDNFKKFNDQFGHACGDHALMQVSEILRNRLRDVDRAARWGGEEFIVLLPETNSEGAAAVAEKLRVSIADNRFEFQSIRQRITMTLGVAEHRPGETLDACIARADQALYNGKESGRKKVTLGSYKGLSLIS